MGRGDFNRKLGEDNKELFIDLYCNKNYTIKQLSEYFDCATGTIHKFCKKLGITKTKEQISFNRKMSWEQNDRNVRLPENFEYLYIEKNLTLAEVSRELNIPLSKADTIRSKFHLTKSKEQKDEVVRRLAKEKYSDIEKVKEINRKRAETNIKKYGVPNPLMSPEIREKAEQTNLKNIGVKNQFQAKDFDEKRKKKSLEKYGTEFPSQSEQVKKKMRETMKEKYGVENITQSPEFKEKVKWSNFERYNGKWFQQRHIPEETIAILSSKKALEEYIKNSGYNTTKSIAEHLGVSNAEIQHKISEFELYHLIDSKSSYAEEEITNILDGWGIKHYKTKKILRPQEIDIYCPDFDVGIEFNGDYWHREERMGVLYHQEKSLKAREKGIFLFHVFEYEWLDEEKRAEIIETLRKLFFGEKPVYNNKTIEIDIGKTDIKGLKKQGYSLKERKMPISHSVIGGRFVVYDCGAEVWVKLN